MKLHWYRRICQIQIDHLLDRCDCGDHQEIYIDIKVIEFSVYTHNPPFSSTIGKSCYYNWIVLTKKELRLCYGYNYHLVVL